MIRRIHAAAVAVLAMFLFATDAVSQADYKRYFDEDNLPGARELFHEGRYDIIVQLCEYAFRRGQPSWEWRTLYFQALANLGEYEQAFPIALETAEKFKGELGALLEIHRFFTELGKEEEAKAVLDDINTAASAVPTDERTALDYVRLGEAALVLGADPATVIEQYFALAKQSKPKGQDVPPGLLEAYLASGKLALEKDDFSLAAKEFEGAYEFAPTHPEVLFGLARAFLSSNREVALKHLQDLQERYPLHFGALLLQAEFAINYEKYEEAKAFLDQVESLNPKHPLSHAYRAVLAELESNDDAAFERERQAALSVWKSNPEIDHLIGRVLSRRYRHKEGAECQKRALEFDSDYLPAKLQLALDYLRLGRVEDAWPLAKEVGEADEYNVLAYNLEVLEQEIASYSSIKTGDFIIRLPPKEAEIYGDRVLEILNEADRVLGEKYDLVLDEPTLIEFYPNQQDFAVRTFGSLGGEGLLGVCFGSVVTMNSPGSVTAGRNNWEATLWHEYCHVITLTATDNKMPRWLSEGISVYEEQERQPNWGMEMTPEFRRMILEDGELTAVGDMSQAFFQPESGEHLMFAYYQSALVVRYLVENYGMEAMRSILKDLANGVLINDTVSRHTVPMEELEIAFAAWASELAEAYGPKVDWSKPPVEEVNPLSPLSVAAYLKKNPNNFWANQTHLAELVNKENWKEAAEAADRFIAILPEFTSTGNGYFIKARALRELGDIEGEAAVLEELASRSAEAFAAYQRLVDVHFEEEDWQAVLKNADRSLAINPFVQRTHFCRGCALEALEQEAGAIGAFQKSLLLDPANPSVVRFKLARLLRDNDRGQAKRHLLDSLADSPRYREAYALLLDIEEGPTRNEREPGLEPEKPSVDPDESAPKPVAPEAQ